MNVCHPPGDHHPSSPVHPGLPHPAPFALVLSRTPARCSSTELARLISSERHLQDSKNRVVSPRFLGVARPRLLPASPVCASTDHHRFLGVQSARWPHSSIGPPRVATLRASRITLANDVAPLSWFVRRVPIPFRRVCSSLEPWATSGDPHCLATASSAFAPTPGFPRLPPRVLPASRLPSRGDSPGPKAVRGRPHNECVVWDARLRRDSLRCASTTR